LPLNFPKLIGRVGDWLIRFWNERGFTTGATCQIHSGCGTIRNERGFAVFAVKKDIVHDNFSSGRASRLHARLRAGDVPYR
jgi:hypothetical protein